VAEDVDALKAQISDLNKYVASLSSSPPSLPPSLPSADSSEGRSSERVLEELQGRCASFVKGLMHGLDVLDEMHVTEKVRSLLFLLGPSLSPYPLPLPFSFPHACDRPSDV